MAEFIFTVVVVVSIALVLSVAAVLVCLMGRDVWQQMRNAPPMPEGLSTDCSHEYEWLGGGSTPDGPIEPEHVCKHCGAVDDAD